MPQWQAGQSGNPKGRPPKARALTDILERAGAKTVTITLPDGTEKKLSGRRFLAQAVWELVTTGRVTYATGKQATADPAAWLDTVKWLYAHIDGAPKQSVEMGGPDGGPIQFKRVEDLSDDELASIAARGRDGATGA